MATATTIPINIAPDAAAHVQQLGMQPQFRMMLEQLKQIVPNLRTIQVTLEYPPDYDDDPMILFSTHQPEYSGEGLDPTDVEWRTWLSKTFGPDVWQHFVRLAIYEPANGR